jgi:hypothetical protein
VPKRQVARVALRDDETLALLICRLDLVGAEPSPDLQKAVLRHAFTGMGWEVPELLARMDDATDFYFDP